MKPIAMQPGFVETVRRTHARRRGTTLSEVLVSVLVMSIGVVALATLFPISVLRSLQATQLTNATILRYNAEAQIRTVPELVNVGSDWQPTTNYAVGTIVVPATETRRRIPAMAFKATTGGNSGGTEPDWNKANGNSTNDGAAVWQTYRLRNYVVDPLGYHLVASGTPMQNYWGNDGTNPFNPLTNPNNPPTTRPALPIYRFPGFGATNESLAAAACVLPDTWTHHADSVRLSNLTATSIDLDGTDAAELATSVVTTDTVPDRIILIDDTGRRSQTRTVTGVTAGVSGARINWPTGQPLPAGFTPVKARVESLVRRYTYLLSVRRGSSGTANIDVVVMFNRRYLDEVERVYSAQFMEEIANGLDGQPGVVGVDDDQNGTVDDNSEKGTPGSDDIARNFVIIQYNSTSEPKPFYKKGGYVCDVMNLRWYRIIDVYEPLVQTIAGALPQGGFTADTLDTSMTSADRFVRLTLDQPILENSTYLTNGDIYGGAILMPGIVDVFPIRPQTPWEE